MSIDIHGEESVSCSGTGLWEIGISNTSSVESQQSRKASAFCVFWKSNVTACRIAIKSFRRKFECFDFREWFLKSPVEDRPLLVPFLIGRIIERGSHEKLIAERGTYYQLYTGNLAEN